MSEADLPQLSDTARAAVVKLTQLMSERFTGEIIIVASEGGVRSMKAGKQWTGEALTNGQKSEASDDALARNARPR